MDIVINHFCETQPSDAHPFPTEGDFLLNALVAMGHDREYPPLADLLRRYKQLAGQWLIASPLHWQATHNDAMIIAAFESLHLQEPVAAIWFQEVSQYLSQDKCKLVYYDSNHWLMNIDNKPALQSPALRYMLHQSLMPIFDKLDPSMYWQGLITALQMFMGSHPLNSAKNLPVAINGLWFWGQGDLKMDLNRPIMTDSPLFSAVYNNTLPLNLEANFEENTLLLIHEFCPSMMASLTQGTKKQKVNWYWNNTAYQTPIQRWWKRFWRG